MLQNNIDSSQRFEQKRAVEIYRLRYIQIPFYSLPFPFIPFQEDCKLILLIASNRKTSNQQHRFNQSGQGNYRGANNWGHTTGQQHPHNYGRNNRNHQGKRDRSPDPTDDAQERRRIRIDLELYIAEKHGLRPSNSLTLEQLVSELKNDKITVY